MIDVIFIETTSIRRFLFFFSLGLQEVGEAHLQQIISFGDLRLCLNMQAERDCQHFKEAVDGRKRVCREQRQRQAINALQSVAECPSAECMCIPNCIQRVEREMSSSAICYREAASKTVDDYITTTKEGRENLDRFEKTMSELKDAVSWSKSYPFPSNELEEWENKNLQYLIQLGNESTKLRFLVIVFLADS